MLKFTDCIDPDYGYLNKDGYVRVLSKPRKQGGKLKMRHREEWERVNGSIPAGYEINHTCKNRRCINLGHLECLSTKEHRGLDNSLRYKQREQCVLAFLKTHPNLSQSVIAKLFQITQSGVSSIKRRNERLLNGS